MTPSDEAIRAVLMDLAFRRGSASSFCPSEAARALAADWRPLMPRVRDMAAELARGGLMVATRKGAPVDPRAAGGPIRLRLAPLSLAREGSDAGAAGNR
ncbi:MAG: DUF3253 domain-containing protein [Paracoccaceae bacterium]|nr:DUF3253 domain-containing protein [Paracoccaceae bacterium]